MFGILIALFFPFLSMIMNGRADKALVAFILQCCLIGWPVAIYMALKVRAKKRDDARIARIVAATVAQQR